MSEHFIAYQDARDDLLSAASFLAERIKSGDGHAEAMAAIVPRHLAHKNVDLAAELANSVEDPFTRDKLLTEVAEKCAEIDDDEYALQLAESVEEFGLRQQAFERIALQKVAKGKTDAALDLTSSMQHADHVFAAAAVRAAADGESDEAADLLERVEYANAKVMALQSMAMKEFESGNKDACVDLLTEAQSTATEIEHNEERIRALCDVGNHFVEAGRNDLAVGAYDTARQEAEQLDNIHRDSFISAAVLGFLHAGSMDTADRTLDLVKDKTQMSNCLLAFSKYLWERGEKDDALDALDESFQILRSQKEMETRDSRARFALFGSIAAQYAGFEKSERAIEIASAIEDDSYRTSALTQLCSIFELRRETEQARHALREITGDSDRAFALVGMSDANVNIGEFEAAIALLDEATHLVDEIPQLTARSWAYNEIARRYLDRGERQKALDIVSACLDILAQIRDESSRAVALASLSDLFSGRDLKLSANHQQAIDNILTGR